MCVNGVQNKHIQGDTGEVGEGWEAGHLSQCCGAPVWVVGTLWNEMVVMLSSPVNLLKAAKLDTARR